MRVGTIGGIPIRVHWSVVVVIWLFAWSLASTLPDSAPGYSTPAYWLAGLGGATLLAAALLAHELSHAVVARRVGIPVSGITLWLFGGVARLAGEAESPRAEFRMAAAGPALSMVLSGVFAAAGALLTSVQASPLLTAVVMWLAVVNAVLAVFNLLPGAPLDGGRILRAYLWHRHGDPVQAAIGAARAGCVVAYLLIALGLVEFLVGSLIGGAWLVFIGWFLLSAAHAERAATQTGELLAGVMVADVMSPDPRVAPDWISVSEFIDGHLLGDRHSSYPLVARDGSVSGLITLAQLRTVPVAERATVALRDVAIPRGAVAEAGPHEPITAVIDRLTPDTGGRALVIDSGRLVGIVTSADIARLVDVRALTAAG